MKTDPNVGRTRYTSQTLVDELECPHLRSHRPL